MILEQLRERLRPQEEEADEQSRKRLYAVVALALTVPLLSGYGLVYLLLEDDQVLPGVANLGVGALFAVLAVRLAVRRQVRIPYRIGMAALGLLLLANAALGWHGGAGILWLYVYPLAAFYFFGAREGLVWVIAVILPAAVVVLTPLGFSYPPDFRSPLVLSLTLLAAMSFLLESLRAHFVARLERQRAELHAALANIQTLRGLLPICSTCKRIRDDTGYWHAVDAYIMEHADVRFSHGVCDQCLEKHWPDDYRALVEEGAITPATADEPDGS